MSEINSVSMGPHDGRAKSEFDQVRAERAVAELLHALGEDVYKLFTVNDRHPAIRKRVNVCYDILDQFIDCHFSPFAVWRLARKPRGIHLRFAPCLAEQRMQRQAGLFRTQVGDGLFKRADDGTCNQAAGRMRVNA